MTFPVVIRREGISMVMVKRAFVNSFLDTVHRRSAWLLVFLFIIITLFQYAESLALPDFLAHINENLGLTRFSLERILYLLPIIWAGALFGLKGGVITATVAVACMLPRGIFISPNPEDAIVESVAVFIVGNTVAVSLESLRKERERRSELEVAQRELQTQLHIIEDNEKRLAALNKTSMIISQSLQLREVLDSAVSSVMDVMRVEVVRIYIINEETHELGLAAHRGVSEEFVSDVGTIKIGEGFNGRVAETGLPLYVADACEDPRLTKLVARAENIRSQVIVPMMAKGKVVGTIAAAMHSHREFMEQDVELLTAIANQVGVAVDNARLYQQERETSEQLRTSEERYRELFEGAHDAIWMHDLEDNIIAANTACVRLTGYSWDELHNLKASEFISVDSQDTVKRLRERLLKEGGGGRDELKLTRKDGSEAFVDLASSVVFGGGVPVAIQHIARDVTEEKRMRENLRFLVQQSTRSQEEERKRIAQELHDDTVQAMVVHAREIEDLTAHIEEMDTVDIHSRLDALYHEASVIRQGVQRLSQDLRPATLDRLGLVSAVEWIADRTAEYSGMDIKVDFIGQERRLPDEVELVLFRITQEALRNVWKHAGSPKAEVTVNFGEKDIRIVVRDEGKGFEVPTSVSDLPRYGMLGLAGMQERARLLGGSLTVTSDPGAGTTVCAELPV